MQRPRSSSRPRRWIRRWGGWEVGHTPHHRRSLARTAFLAEALEHNPALFLSVSAQFGCVACCRKFSKFQFIHHLTTYAQQSALLSWNRLGMDVLINLLPACRYQHACLQKGPPQNGEAGSGERRLCVGGSLGSRAPASHRAQEAKDGRQLGTQPDWLQERMGISSILQSGKYVKFQFCGLL